MKKISASNNNKRKGIMISFTSVLILFYISRVSLVSLLAYRIFSLPIVFVLGFIAMVIFYVNRRKGKIEINYLFLLAYILIVILSSVLTNKPESAELARGYASQLLALIIAFGTFSYLCSVQKCEKRLLVRWYLLCTIITTGYTCYVASTGDFRIIRNTAFGEYDLSYRFIYGGYDFIYALVIVYIITLTFYMQTRKQLKTVARVLILAMLALFAYTIIISAFSTAFVIILTFTIQNLVSNRWAKYAVVAFILIILFFFPMTIISLIDSIEFIPDLTTTRVNELILSISSSSGSAYFLHKGERGQRILYSLAVFWEHPILGGYIGNTNLPIGGHSEFVDSLARYGLIAFSAVCAFWIDTYKRMTDKTDLSPVCKRCIRNAFIAFVFIGIFDNVSMVVTAAPLFIFAPFCEDIFRIVKKDNESPECEGESKCA